MDTSSSVGRSRDTFANFPFPLSNFNCQYGGYYQLQRFEGMQINEDKASLLYVQFQRNRDTAFGAWKKTW